MLTRVYVDNYRCFVNFEVNFSRFNLVLGSNGTGKTALFEVINQVSRFVTEEPWVEKSFPSRSLTRWETRTAQTFEMDVSGNGGLYRYWLTIDRDSREQDLCRIKEERLTFNDQVIFSAKFRFNGVGEVQLYRDGYASGVPYGLGPRYEAKMFRTALGAVAEHKDNSKLTWFIEYLRKLRIIRIDPSSMTSRSEQEESIPTYNFANFSSWYRYLLPQVPPGLQNFFNDLRDLGFSSLRFTEQGAQIKKLMVEQIVGMDNEKENLKVHFGFDELSDGQRVLITLYAISHLGLAEDFTFCLDEPEAYIGLREMQPWLSTLEEASANNKSQVLLISHHPEIINHLAVKDGLRFYRRNNGPVRVEKWRGDGESGLQPAEIIARGDDDE